jgi:hypothetical protein
MGRRRAALSCDGVGVIVIACYRPKPGKETALLAETRAHWSTLKGEGLVTDRTPIIGKAGDGTVVEVFEWVSAQAIEAAHTNPVVGRMWERYAEVCDYVPIAEVQEAGQLFSSFTPLEN